MLQMQLYIIVVLLLSSGAVSGGLEKVLRIAEFIADIYRQFPHSCIFIINPEAQQQGEDWFFYSNFVFMWTEMCWQKFGVQVLFKLCHHRCTCRICNEMNYLVMVTFFYFELTRNAYEIPINKKVLFIII